ncbi:thermonuclease family protein [Methylophilus medardicus]|uniref:Thermonuclease family protein n=1 Tax=Methylophilus medardicus TaxID=2588534 RepID=A0A5B8CU07_9PROT|nr:thermonuclease family protein [Methylophilus medardicus]QDC44729.1 thermonuclease family protein [Methylophilus medardicus]QDC49736.1 thermonuclease family protein [Methylophilus medardicus]QDC53441.1 thermonuclease family protein [Methylophilus medardicus]
MQKIGWLIGGLFAALCLGAQAQTVLEKVIDGDTVIIREQAITYHLRLLDIDAPERQQAFGQQSKRSLSKLCDQATITVITQGQDMYGRTLGHLYCNEVDASESQVSLGMAWFNARYSQRAALSVLQQQAQQQGLGLWHDANPVPPWQWRQRYGQHYRRQE